MKSRYSILLVLLLSSLSLFAQVKQRYPTNVRYIGGNYVNQSPYFNSLLSALNNVKASASLTNPYVFQIDSDTLYITDWDSVYQTGGVSMIDSIELNYSGKIRFSGMYGRDTVLSVQDTANFVSKATAQVISGAKYFTTQPKFTSGINIAGNSTINSGAIVTFSGNSKLSLIGGYFTLPFQSASTEGSLHADITTGDLYSYGPSGEDTLAFRSWVRANYHPIDTGIVRTTTNQNIFGIKTMYGTLSFTGTSARLVLGDRVPNTTREISANTNGIYFYNGSSVDTIPSRAWVRAGFMDLSYNQSLTGMKTWNTGGITLSGGSSLLLPSSPATKSLGSLWRVGSSGSGLLAFGYGNGTTELDTVVTWRMFRDSIPSVTNSVLLTTDQTVAGQKTFTGNLKFGTTGSIQFPTINNELSNGVFGDNTYLYYTKAGVAGNFDTLLTWNAFQSIPVKRSFVPTINNFYDLGSASYKWNDIYTTNITATNIYTSSIEPSGADTTISFVGATKALKDAGGNVLLYSGAVRTVGTTTYPMDSVITSYIKTEDDMTLQAEKIISNGTVMHTAENVTSNVTAGVLTFNKSYLYFTSMGGAETITALTCLATSGNEPGMIVTIVNVDDTFTVTFDPSGGILFTASGASVVLGENDSITFMAHPTMNAWIQVGASNN